MSDFHNTEVLRRRPTVVDTGTLHTLDQLRRDELQLYRFDLLENLRVAYEGMLALGALVRSIDWHPDALRSIIAEYPNLSDMLELFPDLVIAQDNLEDLLNKVAVALEIDAGFDYQLESAAAVQQEVYFPQTNFYDDTPMLPSADQLKKREEQRFRRFVSEQLAATHHGVMALKASLDRIGNPAGLEQLKTDYPELAAFFNLYPELQQLCTSMFELLNEFGDFSMNYERSQIQADLQEDLILE